MRNVIAFVVAAVSFLGGFYVGGWLLFIQPIISACQAFDEGTLTATIIGVTIIKCMLAAAVGSIIVWLGCTIAGFIQMGSRKRKRH